MLKVLQARLQQYMNGKLPDVKAGLRKGRGSRDHIYNICWIIESSKRASTFASLTTLKPVTVWITSNYGKFFKRWEYQTTLPASEKRVCRSRSKLKPYMEELTGSKLGKEYLKAVYCHPLYLTYMQSTSCEMPEWTKHKLESRLLGEIGIISDTQMT